MKKLWLILFCFSIIVSCDNSNQKSVNPLALVPEHSEILIKINSSEGLNNGLKNNTLIKALKSFTEVDQFNALLLPLQQISTSQSLIALSKTNHDSLEISYIIPYKNLSLLLDSISELKIDTTFNTSENIKKLVYNNKDYYFKNNDSTLFLSNSYDLTKASFSKLDVNPELETIYNTSNNEKMVSLLINHKNKALNPLIFRDSTLNHLQFSNYTMIDSDISQNTILINGITKANDSSKSFITVFDKTIPQENKVATISPFDVSSFKSFTFHNYERFKENMIKHQFQDSTTTYHEVFQNIVEIAEIRSENQTAIALRSLDPSTTFDNFNSQIISEQFRGIDIYSLDNSTLFNELHPAIATFESANYFIALDDFFIVSNAPSYLKAFISNYQNKSVLSESNAYSDIQQNLSDESSLLIFVNSSELKNVINTNFADDKKLDISNGQITAIQFIYDTDFAHVNGISKAHKSKDGSSSVSGELNITLDANLITPPQLVKNHTNSQMDIVAQDTQNNLYLISNQGKVFWKKQLEGKILGAIKQMDIYKNGRLQLVFNTSKRLYILDRNGKDVGAFPLKFNDEITQPVSLFDYDNKKNYRLMITQGKSVLMYDKNGKIVTGFTYKSAENTISSQPKHFRIGRKDYIVFSHGNQLEILDRVGKTRTKVKETISFSENEIYLYNNKFTTSNTNGELLEISSSSGYVNHKNLNTNSEHKIATTSKTLVVMNDNKLTIKSKTVELDFGEYTAPKIFYINDKIYVTVTDLQSKKGYLFDSQAKPIANFPVYANSSLELNNIDKDRALEVITKGDDDAIIVYEIQ
ncbi:ribonuclease HII [Psychroserpens sp. SPM9]|uniref:ribonuclease HII n=1 Tax=Psychroserpens sp. SPM9 TaxID=2975598 RepID=UPI0021A85F8E|nr:ribonuclease HII [Psychroserpens sp. SPM9]MDG5492625.1 ribonuclease HII [Psychroserpens sp. SPM9]